MKELRGAGSLGLLDGFKKAQAHTALADIHESIDELQYYCSGVHWVGRDQTAAALPRSQRASFT